MVKPLHNQLLSFKNIGKVVAPQDTEIWDTAVVKFNGISFGAAAISFNATNVNAALWQMDTLLFLRVDNILQGLSATDNASLFIVNFITNGTGKGKGKVIFGNTTTALEIHTPDTNGQPAVNQAAVFTDGYIVTPFIYNFTGSGNWDIAANWKNCIVPPAALPACTEIIVNPSGTNECVLNVTQTILSGAKVIVLTG